MARYIRSEEPKPRKKSPLLYRISSVDKLLDQIDEQEKELVQYWETGKIEDDVYDRLMSTLHNKRLRAEKRLRKEAGLPLVDEEDVVHINHKRSANDVLTSCVEGVTLWTMKHSKQLTPLVCIAATFYIIF